MPHPDKPTKRLTEEQKQFIKNNQTLRLAVKEYMEARRMAQEGLIGSPYYARERLRLIYRILRSGIRYHKIKFIH